MAITQGHGNPNWNRDETILALEAFFALDGRNPSSKDPLIVALSETLRALPYHGEAARKPTFRNPDGAAFKVQNLRSRQTGKGLGNVSRMDREIWDEFGDKPAEVSRLATLIRAGIASEAANAAPLSDGIEEAEFYEGRLLTQKHMRRERSPAVRKALLRQRGAAGLQCEICSAAHSRLSPELRPAAFEAHHVLPIATVREGVTKLADMALLCAVCHRLLHRLIAHHRRWIGIEEAKALLS